MDDLPRLEPQGIELRRAEVDDADLIRRTLALAADWRSAEPSTSLDALPSAYHDGWGRPDDLGVLAFVGITFVGGAYARRVDPADGTFGYVSGDLHELTIGLESSERGRGNGRLLLESLKAHVLQRGLAGMSLSVALDNDAGRRLYAAAGFETVEERATDVLMAWRVRY